LSLNFRFFLYRAEKEFYSNVEKLVSLNLIYARNDATSSVNSVGERGSADSFNMVLVFRAGQGAKMVTSIDFG